MLTALYIYLGIGFVFGLLVGRSFKVLILMTLTWPLAFIK